MADHFAGHLFDQGHGDGGLDRRYQSYPVGEELGAQQRQGNDHDRFSLGPGEAFDHFPVGKDFRTADVVGFAGGPFVFQAADRAVSMGPFVC